MSVIEAPQRVTPWESARSTLLDRVDQLMVAADSDLGSAVADAAVGPGLLRHVAGGRRSHPRTGWLRTYRPVPTVGFGRRDTRSPGYARATAIAQAHGFQGVIRSAGGRAAAYHRSSLCFELVLPDTGAGPAELISALGEVVAGVLRDLGVDARVGEVPGEYCPGRFSVNAGGLTKIVGTAGRRVRDAILLGGSIVVADARPVRAVLAEVYPALGLTIDPATVTALADVGCRLDEAAAVGEALVCAMAPATRVSFAELPVNVVADAHRASGPAPRAG